MNKEAAEWCWEWAGLEAVYGYHESELPEWEELDELVNLIEEAHNERSHS